METGTKRIFKKNIFFSLIALACLMMSDLACTGCEDAPENTKHNLLSFSKEASNFSIFTPPNFSEDIDFSKKYSESELSSEASPKFSPLSEPLLSPPSSHSIAVQKYLSEEYEEKPSILIIEDQKMIWLIFENKFKKARKDFENFKLLFTPTGEEGIQLHALYRPCMTFMDYHLAGKMNGKDVVETLKEKHQGLFKSNLGYLVAFSNDIDINANMDTDFQLPKMTNIKLFKEALRLGLHQ